MDVRTEAFDCLAWLIFLIEVVWKSADSVVLACSGGEEDWRSICELNALLRVKIRREAAIEV